MNLQDVKFLLKVIKNKKEDYIIAYNIIKQMDQMWGYKGYEDKALELIKFLEICEKHKPIKLKGNK